MLEQNKTFLLYEQLYQSPNKTLRLLHMLGISTCLKHYNQSITKAMQTEGHKQDQISSNLHKYAIYII